MAVDERVLNDSLQQFDAWFELEAAVLQDILGTMDLVDARPEDQVRRRAFGRSAWAYKEACLAGMARWVGTVEDLTNSQHPKRPRERDATLDRIKSTLKWCAERFKTAWRPDFGGAAWHDVRTSQDCRDRLMHPKRAEDLTISDDELAAVHRAAAWFIEAMQELKKGLQALENASGTSIPDNDPLP